jgi:hypothetical protein
LLHKNGQSKAAFISNDNMTVFCLVNKYNNDKFNLIYLFSYSILTVGYSTLSSCVQSNWRAELAIEVMNAADSCLAMPRAKYYYYYY